jgi:hypothetical protein
MEEQGIWRTVGGRRIFIKDGQSLADAMKESGKFSKQKTFGKSILSEDLNDKDKDVLNFYVMDAGAYDVNYVLRGKGEATENDKRAIKDLDEALSKASLNEDVEVYRYISDENVFRDMKEGDVYEEKAFMSTTYDEKTDRESNYADYKVKIVLKAKKGSKALDVSKIYDEQAYDGQKESEIIFARNQKMKLVRVDKEADGRLHSSMTEKEKSVYKFIDRYIYEFETTE